MGASLRSPAAPRRRRNPGTGANVTARSRPERSSVGRPRNTRSSRRAARSPSVSARNTSRLPDRRQAGQQRFVKDKDGRSSRVGRECRVVVAERLPGQPHVLRLTAALDEGRARRAVHVRIRPQARVDALGPGSRSCLRPAFDRTASLQITALTQLGSALLHLPAAEAIRPSRPGPDGPIAIRGGSPLAIRR